MEGDDPFRLWRIDKNGSRMPEVQGGGHAGGWDDRRVRVETCEKGRPVGRTVRLLATQGDLELPLSIQIDEPQSPYRTLR